MFDVDVLQFIKFERVFVCVSRFVSLLLQKRSQEKAKKRHDNVMRLLVRRYITAEQRKRDDFGITEDDVMEIRQDISTLRFELIDILSTNGMKTPNVNPNELSCKCIFCHRPHFDYRESNVNIHAHTRARPYTRNSRWKKGKNDGETNPKGLSNWHC